MIVTVKNNCSYPGYCMYNSEDLNKFEFNYSMEERIFSCNKSKKNWQPNIVQPKFEFLEEKEFFSNVLLIISKACLEVSSKKQIQVI